MVDAEQNCDEGLGLKTGVLTDGRCCGGRWLVTRALGRREKAESILDSTLSWCWVCREGAEKGPTLPDAARSPAVTQQVAGSEDRGEPGELRYRASL